MDAFKCINCNKVHSIKSNLIACNCGKGKLNINIPRTIPKEKVVTESELTRKELISALKEKDIITSAKAVSNKGDEELREMLG